jgi:hypothetical protein
MSEEEKEDDEVYELQRLCMLFVLHIESWERNISPKNLHEVAIEQALRVWNQIKTLDPKMNVVKTFKISEMPWKEEYGPYLDKMFLSRPRSLWDCIFRRKKKDE